jgi:hypothetical protein
MNRVGLIAALALLTLAGVCGAAILNVPDDYQTIQAGIDASEDGDTVLVHPGRYAESLTITNREITVGSLYLTTADEAYVDSTIVTCANVNSDRIFTLQGDADLPMTLVGLTIRDGHVAGIELITGRAIFSHCIIRKNSNFDYAGAIIAYQDTDLELYYCTIDSNSCDIRAGGIRSYGPTLIAEHCTFRANVGGIVGAVYLVNYAGTHGFFNYCLFTNNSGDRSDVFTVFAADAQLDHCTIVKNGNNQWTPTILMWSPSTVEITNSILWANAGPEIDCSYDGIDTVLVTYCDLEGGENDAIIQSDNDLVTWGDGNIDSDPVFTDPDNGNFRLQGDSPCIDAGDPDAEPDRDSSRTDMGAFPFIRQGVIQGYVTDSVDNIPIEGAKIKASYGIVTRSDAEGYFFLSGALVDNGFSLTAEMRGWFDSTATGLQLQEHETLNVNFALRRPLFEPQVDSIAGDVTSGCSLLVDFGIANRGNAPLRWSAEKELADTIAAWDLQMSYPISQTVGDPRIEGVVFTGSRFYISGGGAGRNLIYILDRDGLLLGDFAQPWEGHYGMLDLAWDGELIWGSRQGEVYGMDTTGQIVYHWDGPGRTNRALTWDSDHELLWIGDVTGERIFGCDRFGQQTSELSSYHLYIYGLAYLAEDADNCPLYLLTAPGYNNSPARLYKINPDHPDTVFVSNLGRPVGSPRGAEFVSEAVPFTTSLLTVFNDGENDRLDIWFLKENLTWLGFKPMQDVLERGGQQNLHCTLSAGDLIEGVLQARIHFDFPDIYSGFDLPVTIQVKLNSISDLGFRIAEFGLGEAYPNPFNNVAVTSYKLQVTSRINLALYDINGRLVQTIADGEQAAGEHRATINGEWLSSGVYLLGLTAGKEMAARKIVCVK